MTVPVKRRIVSISGEEHQGEQMPFDPATGLPVADPLAPGGPLPIVIHHVQDPPEPTAPQYLTREEAFALVERAREEEKNKLYGRIDELSTTVQTLSTAEQERIATAESARQAAEDEARRLQEADMSTRDLFEQYKSEQDRRFEELEQERQLERAIHQKDLALFQLNEYLARRRGEVQAEQSVAPELLEFIGGSSEEEIEASIARVQAKTDEIADGFRQMLEQQGQLPQRRPMMVPTGAPPIDPLGDAEQRQQVLTPADIANMPMEEYAANRHLLLGAASQRVREGGLYQR